MAAQYKYDNYTDAKLAEAVDVALKASDGAGKAQAIVAGKLLAVGRKRYPADVDFEKKFLKLTGGVGLSRARDLIAISEGRKDWDKHLAVGREAACRYRDRVKGERQKARQLAIEQANLAEASRHDVMAQAEAKAVDDDVVVQAGDDPTVKPDGFETPAVVTALHLIDEGRRDGPCLSMPVSLVPPAGTVDPFAAFRPVKKPQTEPRLTAAAMKKMASAIEAELPETAAPPIASEPVDKGQRLGGHIDSIIEERAHIMALDMVAKGERSSSEVNLASFRVACEMYLQDDGMNDANKKTALGYAALCASDDDETDGDDIAIPVVMWPPIYAEAAAS